MEKSFSPWRTNGSHREEPVVGNVERDPDERDHHGGTAELLRDELAHGALRLGRDVELRRLDRPPRDLAQDARGLLGAAVAGEPIRALGEGEARQEREEGRERRGQEEITPAVVTADLVEEEPGEARGE